MNRVISAGLFVSALGLVTFAEQSEAHALSCIDHLLSGLGQGCYSNNVRRFELTIQRRDASWVSYSNGYFFKTTSGQAASLSDTYFAQTTAQNVNERFSGRVNGTCTTYNQDFANNNADSHSISINPTTGVISIVNATWGFTDTLAATCNGDAILASNGTSMFTITWASALSYWGCIQ